MGKTNNPNAPQRKAKIVEFFFDASAVIKYYHQENGTKIVRFWFERLEKDRNIKPSFFLPNVCIPEVLRTFYYKAYVEQKIKEETLKIIASQFIQDLRTEKIISYDLTEEHIIATDMVYPKAFCDFQSRHTSEEKTLSAVDVMVISMALVFSRNHPKMYLVTADKEMNKIVSSFNLTTLDPTNFKTIPPELKP